MKKRATVFLASALLLGAMTVTAVHTGAVPADPTPFLTEQPDGTAITVRTYGDEHFNWNEDDDGWLICYSEDDRAWYYAELDENNDLVPGPFAVGEENVAYGPPAEPTATRLSFEDIAEIAESRAEASIAASAVCLGELPYAEEAYASASASSAAASSAAKKKNTSQDLLLLLIEYTDISIQNTMDFWEERYFGEGKNSVTGYYKDQTGKYDLHFNRIDFKGGNTTVTYEENPDISKIVLEDGVAKVTFKRPHPGSTEKGSTNAARKTLVGNDVKTAFSYVKDYINFEKYTGDAVYNDHILQDYFQTAAVIAGWDESSSGSKNHDQKVWAYAYYWYFGDRIQFSLNLYERDIEGVMCPPYTLMSYMLHGELYSGNLTDGSAQTMGVGVSVHEMGHCLGLPDLYDTGSDSSGLSGFSVMANGSWGAKKGEVQGTTPVGLDAWSKIKLGFAEPVEISAEQRNVYEELTASSDQPDILKLTSPEDKNQYFLVENRQLTGYDQGLEKYGLGYIQNNGGICIYHIDESVITSGHNPNINRYHYGVELLFADGSTILREKDQRDFRAYAPFFSMDGYHYRFAPGASLFYTPGHTKIHYEKGDVQCHSKIIPSWISLKVTSFSGPSMNVIVNPTLVGDVNDDGAVTAVDRMLLARHLAGWKIDVPLNLYAADLDQDGDADDKDVEIFNRYFAGWANYTTLPHKKST